MRRFGSLTLILVLAAIFIEAAQATVHAATCEIDERKKRAIYEVLCGQLAPEQQYRFSGPGCFANSVRKRLDDSAAQVLIFRICGDREFSDRLKEANLKTISFMETLSVCTPERVDLRKVMEDALSAVSQRASGASCTSDLRAKISDRRPYFERMMGMANDHSFVSSIFERLGIRVDSDGSVREKLP